MWIHLPLPKKVHSEDWHENCLQEKCREPLLDSRKYCFYKEEECTAQGKIMYIDVKNVEQCKIDCSLGKSAGLPGRQYQQWCRHAMFQISNSVLQSSFGRY